MLALHPGMIHGTALDSSTLFRNTAVIDICSGTNPVAEVCAKYGKFVPFIVGFSSVKQVTGVKD